MRNPKAIEQVVKTATTNTGIYEIVNIKNGKKYIGSAINIRLRWNTHKCHLRKGKHPNIILQSTWDKHGEGGFVFNIVQLCSDQELLEYEQEIINDHISKGYKLYNIREIAKSNLGFRHSDEAKSKMSASRIGEKNPNYGKRRTKEFNDKMSLALKGRKAPNKGIKMSDEQKEKLRASKLGKKTGPKSEEVKRKISETRMGTPAWNKGMKRVTPNLFLPPDEALLWIDKRRQDRELRGVLATYQK